MKIIKITLWLLMLFASLACEDYLDIVPDNVATLDYAFTRKQEAEKYLFTCYSFLPSFTSFYYLILGDEFWLDPQSQSYFTDVNVNSMNFSLGKASASNPIFDLYHSLYRGIRVCNTFLQRIETVPDIREQEKKVWKAEVKFLKGYYHFLLLRMYGPIILRKENLPVSATPAQVKQARDPFDDCVKYISDLFSEAAADLPLRVSDPAHETGRITQPIALGMKAKLLITAASPLFNGNPNYTSFKNKAGQPFFTAFDNKKWKLAADAALEAIQVAEQANYQLYEYTDKSNQYSAFTKRKLTLRGRVPQPQWEGKEIIWADIHSTDRLQLAAQARLIPRAFIIGQILAPTFRIVEQYYTRNGVPIEEDKSWMGRDIFSLKTSRLNTTDTLWVKNAKTTVQLHFDREPRFYADIGFDRGIWFGQGRYDEKYTGNAKNSLYYAQARQSEISGKISRTNYSITSYFSKKLVYYKNVMSKDYRPVRYDFPILRLADLYLLYAEALNEYSGPSSEVYKYLNKIRARAGLLGVVESWRAYAKEPNKPNTKEGLRDIIRRERLIEFALEGHRLWDLRRWKLAAQWMNTPIKGWNVEASERKSFYTVTTLAYPEFRERNYLWPINNNFLLTNTSLVQNPGY